MVQHVLIQSPILHQSVKTIFHISKYKSSQTYDNEKQNENSSIQHNHPRLSILEKKTFISSSSQFYILRVFRQLYKSKIGGFYKIFVSSTVFIFFFKSLAFLVVFCASPGNINYSNEISLLFFFLFFLIDLESFRLLKTVFFRFSVQSSLHFEHGQEQVDNLSFYALLI